MSPHAPPLRRPAALAIAIALVASLCATAFAAVTTTPLRAPAATVLTPVPQASAVPPASAPAACPVSAASSLPGSGSGAAGACGSACCAADAPLRLARAPEPLPAARRGQAYSQWIAVEGGRPPYQFTLLEGALPDGLMLGARGLVSGVPEQVQLSRFTVAVQDQAGVRLRQTFDLRVRAVEAAKPPTPAKPASAPASAASSALSRLTTLDAVSDPHAQREPSVTTYQLPEQALKALGDEAARNAAADAGTDPPIVEPPDPAASAPPPLPGMPPDLNWSKPQQAQLTVALAPLLTQEFPSRDLFLAAVRMRVCAHMGRVIADEARRRKQTAQDPEAFLASCTATAATRVPVPSNPSTPSTLKARRADQERQEKLAAQAAAAYAAAASAAASGELPVASVRTWLLPPGLEPWLADAAKRERPLLPAKPLDWTGSAGCGCAADHGEHGDQPIYAFYPTWMNDVQPQAMNFGLINRMSVFALPLGSDIALPQGWSSSTEQTAFARAARRHGTRLDVGLYGNDWRFLQLPTAEQWPTVRQQLPRQLAARTRQILDTPLPGWWEDVKAWMPFFAERQYLGDGVTIVIEEPPAAGEAAARFAEFYPAFVRALAEEMGRHRRRTYTINLVVTLPMLQDHPSFGVPALFELLKAVEQPTVVNGRIVATQSDYQRGSNVELRVLVLMPEPTALSKKLLRQLAEDSAALHGTDRRIFLRSLIPVLQLPSPDAQQFQDDMVYAQDNFGGLGFWPAPLDDKMLDAPKLAALGNVFGPGAEPGQLSSLCNWVCPNRWGLRLLLELLVLAGIAVWVALQLNCEWRRRFGRVALLAGLPPLLVAFALTACDPAMAFLRNGIALMGLLVAAMVVFLVRTLLKRKVEKP